ncbi:YopX family protein [Heyndrickxia oleronia]|uniref:YopX family protein n=1 Tax=Heyndrickxia oleronia TaxID=38875 RepID=UPI00203FE50F|nr:YopX family protein [Heyndrickxia oleronia]MCM3454430.1 YopX family protein [Heyndrickxia oleronia]
MREIKFDAIYKPTGEHFTPIEINFNDNTISGSFDGEINDWCHFSLDDKRGDVILRQYTGLKDKNGKEIYEGDILQLRNKENKPYHMEVLWTGQGYGYKIIRNDTKSSGYIVGHLSERGLNFYNQTAEVIGNIYEKPSLLEV